MNPTTPPVRMFLLPALFMASVGWVGLSVLTVATIPTVGPRWLFFFLLVLALTGSVLPLVAFLNRRFDSPPAADSSIIVRQSLWFGIYGATLSWLQMGRTLTMPMSLVLLLGLVVIEGLLRLNERSQWKP